MEKKEYKPVRGHVGMPGGPHGARGGEKAKDLVGIWKKLLGYCRKYLVISVIAILCSAIGTVLMLIGPDKPRRHRGLFRRSC